MHNFGRVISFEVVRALKKKSFWVVALLFPLVIAVIFVIISLSGKAADTALDKLTQEDFSIAVMDQSKLVKPELLKALKADTVKDKAASVEDVRTGKLDAFIYYPADLAKQPIEVYGKEVGIFEDSRYTGVADNLLKGSVEESVPESVRLVLTDATKTSSTMYLDGQAYDPIKQMILPGMFLVLFYFLIAFFGGQMLTVATEEKENRVVEMLLTTIHARTLILGKIAALLILAFVQGLLIVLPAVGGYLLFHDQMSLPAIDLAGLPVDWSAIGLGALILFLSLLLFTGLLVFVGTIVPTAKEAGQFFGVMMVLIFGPLYASTLFVSSPESGIVTFLTLFPLTAPIPLMLRNAIGNLEGWEVAVSLTLLTLTAVLVLMLVVRAFRFGALEYSRRLSIKEMTRRG